MQYVKSICGEENIFNFSTPFYNEPLDKLALVLRSPRNHSRYTTDICIEVGRMSTV